MSPSWQQARIISSDTLSSSSLAAELVVVAEVAMLAAPLVMMSVSPGLALHHVLL
jgi:hypothetical protein